VRDRPAAPRGGLRARPRFANAARLRRRPNAGSIGPDGARALRRPRGGPRALSRHLGKRSYRRGLPHGRMGLVRARRDGDLDGGHHVLQLRPLPQALRARRDAASLHRRQPVLEREPLRELRQRPAARSREQRSRPLVDVGAIFLKTRRRAHVGRRLGDTLRKAWIEYERDRARYFAAAMVYYAFLSLVPFLLLLLAALGLLLRFSASARSEERRVLIRIEEQFGGELHATIDHLLTALQRESASATAISIAALLLTASVLFRHLRMSFRAIWKRDPPLIAARVRSVVRATLLERAISFVMVLGGGVLLLAALAMMAGAQWLNLALGGLPLLGPTAEWLLPPLTS